MRKNKVMEQIKVEELSEIKRKITLNVDSGVVENKISEFFNEIKKDVTLNGFRKGKVPLNVLKARFGEHARSNVSQGLIADSYNEAIKSHNLNPVGDPTIVGFTPKSKYAGTFAKDNSFTADLLIEVLPTIDPVGYTGLSLEVPDYNIDELLQNRLSTLQDQFAERTQVTERPAQLGDMLVVDFTGFMDGVAFDGGSATNFTLDNLGSSNFIPGFEDQLVGMSAGETKTIEVTFPEEYGVAQLAGKPATFEITLHSIVETKRAELNDDLAMMAGYESVEELTTKTREELESEVAKQNRGRLEFSIVQELLKTNEFEVPETLINGELDRIVHQLTGGKSANLQQEVKDSLRNTAKINVQKALLFDAIYNKEIELEVGPEELDALLDEHAKMNNKSKDEFVSLLYNSNQMDAFLGILKNSKVVDFIVKSAKSESEESDGHGRSDGSDQGAQ